MPGTGKSEMKQSKVWYWGDWGTSRLREENRDVRPGAIREEGTIQPDMRARDCTGDPEIGRAQW